MILEIIKINKLEQFPKQTTQNDFIDFLYEHLGKYGDPKKDISCSIQYAFSKKSGKGGFILLVLENTQIIGGSVINDTGMKGYIPEHILAYIAIHKDHRGMGLGTTLLKRVFRECRGDIALHVEYGNPAYRLYKRVGFKSKFAICTSRAKDRNAS